MSPAALRVVAPGPLTTVQDLGRRGYQRYGVSVSGAADTYALRLGNLLVGNDQRAAAVEVTLGGAEFEFNGAAMLAITGADLNAELNGRAIATWQTVAADDGDRLTLSGPGSGIRAYVNLSGGVDTQPVLGSRSTHPGARLGGIEGRALLPGDVLPVGPVVNQLDAGRRVPDDLIPRYGPDIVARVVPGPQDDRFDRQATETFYGAAYSVSERSDRMGCRLEGPEVAAIDGAHDIVSDGVVNGAVQVPGDARPIVLLADRQTTGGYAKIGVVAAVDLGLIAQAAPGATVRCERTTVTEAQSLSRARSRRLRAISFEAAPHISREQRAFDLRIAGVDYHVEIEGTGGGPVTARVNGVEYAVEVAPGEHG